MLPELIRTLSAGRASVEQIKDKFEQRLFLGELRSLKDKMGKLPGSLSTAKVEQKIKSAEQFLKTLKLMKVHEIASQYQFLYD